MRGTTAIEFSLILPVFLLFIFGSIELGNVLWIDSSLAYGATYGARYAFAHPTYSNAQVQSYAFSTTILPTTVNPYTVTGAGGAGGTTVTITGSFTYNFLVLPLDPLTLTITEKQILPLSS